MCASRFARVCTAGLLFISGSAAAQLPDSAAATLVERLDFDRYRENIRVLAAFGTRYWSTEGNAQARDWIQTELESYGYEVERHAFESTGRESTTGLSTGTVDNVYATLLGQRSPDRMYIVSAHLDSFNLDSRDQSFAPGADDDASGTSLVIEMARVFASADIETNVSVRFILWNAEEVGLRGSAAYVRDRLSQQGIEAPVGSGRYPEPVWLGIVQHDMMLFDRDIASRIDSGEMAQTTSADIDIEYTTPSATAKGSIALAAVFLAANATYAEHFPAEVGQFMRGTDSVSFSPHVPAISLRENERGAEIGRGSNPHWHRDTDAFETYDDDDFRLGFAALQTSTGAIALLVGARFR